MNINTIHPPLKNNSTIIQQYSTFMQSMENYRLYNKTMKFEIQMH